VNNSEEMFLMCWPGIGAKEGDHLVYDSAVEIGCRKKLRPREDLREAALGSTKVRNTRPIKPRQNHLANPLN